MNIVCFLKVLLCIGNMKNLKFPLLQWVGISSILAPYFSLNAPFFCKYQRTQNELLSMDQYISRPLHFYDLLDYDILWNYSGLLLLQRQNQRHLPPQDPLDLHYYLDWAGLTFYLSLWLLRLPYQVDQWCHHPILV